MRKFDDIFRKLRLAPKTQEVDKDQRDQFVWELVQSIVEKNPSFVHLGNLKTHEAVNIGTRNSAEKYEFEYCGGLCRTSANDDDKLQWQCDNCLTYTRFRRTKKDDVSTTLLHLLIKQMVPPMRACNYIWTKETGVVGILDEALAYKRQQDQGTIQSWVASLGFVLMPGMHTLDDLGGFDEWLRYLVQVKFDQLNVMAESERTHLIGPKHLGELNRGWRFWR